jgi:hypothetical protein
MLKMRLPAPQLDMPVMIMRLVVEIIRNLRWDFFAME